MSLAISLLHILADGTFHSGEELGQQLGVSRTAVWKTLQQYDSMGLDIHAVHGRGYRLSEPVELLDADIIKKALRQDVHALLESFDVHMQIDSTNAWLMQQPNWHGRVCLAEQQTAGRGRRGRQWVSPFAANIYLSLGWQFSLDSSALAGLSLACGVAVIQALKQFGVSDAGLKWPNDILRNGRKLGGILIEIRAEAGGTSNVVVGLGLNVHMPESVSTAIDQPWTDLRDLDGATISRNRLTASLLNELTDVCCACAEGKLSAYLEHWQEHDVHIGKQVTLHLPDGSHCQGLARGIDTRGALLMEEAGAIRRFSCGEVSLRNG